MLNTFWQLSCTAFQKLTENCWYWLKDIFKNLILIFVLYYLLIDLEKLSLNGISNSSWAASFTVCIVYSLWLHFDCEVQWWQNVLPKYVCCILYTGFEMLFVYFGAFSQQVRDLMACAFVLICCCPRLNAAFSDALAELVLFLCRPTLFLALCTIACFSMV